MSSFEGGGRAGNRLETCSNIRCDVASLLTENWPSQGAVCVCVCVCGGGGSVVKYYLFAGGAYHLYTLPPPPPSPNRLHTHCSHISLATIFGHLVAHFTPKWPAAGWAEVERAVGGERYPVPEACVLGALGCPCNAYKSLQLWGAHTIYTLPASNHPPFRK